MVIRIWIYRVDLEKAPSFEEFQQQVGLPMVASQPGCLRVEFSRRYAEESADEQPGQSEYTMISRWESREKLDAALASPEWRDELLLFQAQHFSDKPGLLSHYEQLI